MKTDKEAFLRKLAKKERKGFYFLLFTTTDMNNKTKQQCKQ
jgi:hypothetical protein